MSVIQDGNRLHQSWEVVDRLRYVLTVYTRGAMSEDKVLTSLPGGSTPAINAINVRLHDHVREVIDSGIHNTT
jgi:hypothetical protein